MEAILLAIYAFFVWLIFIKFKWLPWNTASQVIVVIIPVVALTALILTLNVVAPSSADVRVIKYVVQVIPQVRGRVIEVPVEPNRLVKKGELLFRIDPTQYQNDLNVAKAKLAADEAKFAQAGAGVVDASASARQLQEQLKSASGQVSALQPRLELARLRVRQTTRSTGPRCSATASMCRCWRRFGSSRCSGRCSGVRWISGSTGACSRRLATWTE